VQKESTQILLEAIEKQNDQLITALKEMNRHD